VRRAGLVVRIPYLLTVSLLLALASAAAWANPVTTDHVTARLIPETAGVRPGGTLWVMLHLKIKEGWHTYWRNPGDSGEPPHIRWTLPDGVEAGDIQWPYPDPLPYGPLLNYGYSGEALHLVPIRLAQDWPKGKPVPIRAKVGWLACSDICVPEGGDFELTVTTEDGGPAHESTAALFQKARARLPVKTGWTAGLGSAGEKIVLTVAGDGLNAGRIQKAAFFPYKWGVVEPSAPQTLRPAANGLSLEMTRGQTPDSQRLDGVLVLTEALHDGPVTRAYEIAALAQGEKGAAASAPAPASASGTGNTAGEAAATVGILEALLFAIVGGLILNLMPCVFPVLSMKAMALIRHAEQAPRTIRLHGVAYTAGVLSCFAVLAGLLIALKAGGEAAGWGFQLQSPAFVAVMAYLFFLLGLNLSGFFEIGGAVGIGSGLAARGGYSGSYFTGVLAAVVSTPCTAPFMGVALGFALTQPAPVSLAVFLALGVGFALPYLLLTFVPALVRLLPRPGAWMERTRQFLAFPLYASAAWLVWVLSIQTGPDGVLAALAGMVLIAFGLWLWNVVRDAGPRGRLLGRSGTAAAAVAALALVAGLGIASAPTAPQPASGQSASGPKYERFSSERLATLRAGGKPVFVNMTAAWCITCLVNERVALSSAAVTEQFEAQGITYLKGDWTNGDPEITALLESFGRSGVPLYVLYGPGSSAPTLLPQLLTETLVLDALRDLSGKTKLTDRSNRRSS